MIYQIPIDSQEPPTSNDPWVVEWCCSGGQRGLFHIQNLSDAIASNQLFFAGLIAPDPWLIIGVFDNAEDAHDYAFAIAPARKEQVEFDYQEEVQP